MTHKIRGIWYTADGAEIRYSDEITDSEKDTVQEAFGDGVRDVGELRDMIDDEAK